MIRFLLVPSVLSALMLGPCSGALRSEPPASAQTPAPGIAVASRDAAGSAAGAAGAASAAGAPVAEAAETASVDAPLVIRPRPLVAPITPRMVSAMRAIAARDTTLRPDVFAKMGGSSVVNHGFLHCFEDEPSVDFRGRPLDATLAYFRDARVGSHSPFARTSVAAAVGWSIRHALAGRPPYVLQEIRATSARWALAFFGSNDVEGKNAHQFAGRLDKLVMTLTERGVVPILGATYPRRANDPDMNEQVRRYNRMSAAIASAWGLPYVDFHQPMMTLPGRGLAGDGYHPNSYIVGPRSRACDFGEQGLRYGNNHRNLMTLTALDAVRRTVVGTEPVDEPDSYPFGQGSAEDPVRITALPFARRLADAEVVAPVVAAAAAALATPAGPVDTNPECVTDVVPGARTFVARFTLGETLRLRASAVAMGPLETHVRIRRLADARCLGRGEDDEVVTLEAGTYELIVRTARPRRVADEDAAIVPRVLVVLDVDSVVAPALAAAVPVPAPANPTAGATAASR